jgi:ferredoxin
VPARGDGGFADRRRTELATATRKGKGRAVTTAHLYDPLDPKYLDPTDARAERDRTFHICSDCRICVRLCPSFRSLFQMIDERDAHDHADAVDELTDAEHERVVDVCYQCKLGYVVCPYTPDQQQEWVVDFPRLMLRSLAIQAQEGKVSRSAKLLARTGGDCQLANTAIAEGAGRQPVHPLQVLARAYGLSEE